MAEMLLINPRKRRASKRRTVRAGAKRRVHRRKNPVSALGAYHKKRTHRRRSNPIRAMRRRRNPAALGSGSMMNMIRDAVMGGAGALMIDVIFGQVNKFLPATLQKTQGTIGAGDAVKAVGTVLIGQLLNKATRGYSRKAAAASLTVQAYALLKGFVPSTLPLGYASPAMIAQGTNRVGPIRQGVNAYVPGTPLLSAYTKKGAASPLLNGASRVGRREGVSMFY